MKMKKDWTYKLKEQMEDYTEQPSDEVWSRICAASGMADTRKSRIIPAWLWKSTAAAAALVGGALLFIHVNTPADGPLTAESTSAASDTETAISGIASVKGTDSKKFEPIENAAKSSYIPSEIVQLTSAAPVNAHYADGDRESALNGNAADEVSAQNIVIAEYPTDGEAEERGSEEIAQETPALKKSAAKPSDGTDADAWDRFLSGPESKNRTRGKLSAGLDVNSSGKATSSFSRPNTAVLGANPLESGTASADWIDSKVEKNSGYLVYNQPEVKTEYSHKMPVRIGASVRYDFCKFAGIGTGVTYSMLASDLKTGDESAGGSWSKGTQTLHYIGIPLDMNLNIFSSRYFSAYITAGGMMEKCVRGTVRTDEYVDGKYHGTSSMNLKENKLLWSVNGAAGLQVNILPNLGIYVEPGISHHFSRSGALRSIYTEKPTDFSLGFGLRYTFHSH